LYHSSYIGKAQLKNKGKISRYLANKLAMTSRIDFFSADVILINFRDLKTTEMNSRTKLKKDSNSLQQASNLARMLM
jgi:RNA processing factor Prp31